MRTKLRVVALLVALVVSIGTLLGCEGLPLDDIFSQNSGVQTPDDGDENNNPDEDQKDNAEGDDGADGGEEGDSSPPDFSTDPYIGVNKTEFYKNYKPAVCLADALYRSAHSLMSGSIADQDQAPTIAENQPREGGKLIRNTSAIYEDDGDTYVVLDAEGNIAFRVYRGGGYTSLEEVAAYVYAFGDFPANHISKKSGTPSANPWGKYLRLNHSYFSGDTSKYPYEPMLPDISGGGGVLRYYEMDIGTTGTDCDPKYKPKPYNTGSTITRGAARIVYTRQDKNGNGVIEANECYVFYTYNHYNDFQEYLNYAGGWGEMFGNITGGGAISSKTDYNPTPYVPTAYRDFSTSATFLNIAIVAITPELMRKY